MKVFLIKYKKANLATLEYYATEDFPCTQNCTQVNCEQHLVAGQSYSHQQRPLFQWNNPIGKGGFRKC